MYLRSAAERSQHSPFSEDVITEARSRSITLISTSQLLEAIERLRNEEVQIVQIKQALTRSGVFEIR